MWTQSKITKGGPASMFCFILFSGTVARGALNLRIKHSLTPRPPCYKEAQATERGHIQVLLSQEADSSSCQTDDLWCLQMIPTQSWWAPEPLHLPAEAQTSWNRMRCPFCDLSEFLTHRTHAHNKMVVVCHYVLGVVFKVAIETESKIFLRTE